MVKTKSKIDVSDHILIPKHVKLSEKDKKELFERYKISLDNIPRISRDDAPIANMDVKPGDIIKIIRKSPTAGEALFYRVVSNG